MTTKLSDRSCEACRPDSAPVADPRAFLAELPEWSLHEVEGVPRISRRYAFADFAQALAFTTRVGFLAESEDHHPRLVTEWGSVTVSWWTHAIGGLHLNDFILAARTDELFAVR